ncbi:MAG: dihydrodipicolinate reductase C-terminal domain-containing protein [Acidobacteriota bacterium]
MRALLVGYGRMGKAIEAVLVARGHVVSGRLGRREICLEGEEGNGALWGAASDAAASGADVAFEFTAPDSAGAVVPLLLSKKIPVLSGTTGWDIASALRQAREQQIPFLHSPNFSLGVAALRLGVAAVARSLAPFPEFEPGIVERHHSKKKDAPSGTAKALAAEIEGASGRAGIPIASLRHGGAPGEHVVFFEGEDETVELVHRARSRAIFAQGAVRAAEWMLKSRRRGPLTFDEFFNDASRGGIAP